MIGAPIVIAPVAIAPHRRSAVMPLDIVPVFVIVTFLICRLSIVKIEPALNNVNISFLLSHCAVHRRWLAFNQTPFWARAMFDLLSSANLDDDIAFSWIQELFSDNPAMPLSAAFGVFATTVSFLGVLFLSWHVLIGIVNSAYTGKVLGERWHQVWAPLRVVLGFGLLVPIDDGFSSVHMLLKNVVGVAAVNLGNAPIFAYIDSATDRENLNKLHTDYGTTLAKEVLLREVCYHVVTANNGVSGRYASIKPLVSQPNPSGTTKSWFSSSIQKWDWGQCGSITFVRPEQGDSEIFKDTETSLQDFHDKRVNATGELIEAIQKSNFINYDKLSNFLAIHGDWNTESSVPPEIVDAFKATGVMNDTIIENMFKIGTKWNETVSAEASKVFAVGTEKNAARLKERITQYGFMVAGSYERSLSAISGMAVALAGESPQITTADMSDLYLKRVVKAVQLVQTLRGVNTTEAIAAGIVEPEDNKDWMTYAISKVLPANLANMKLAKTSADPVGDMITFGHTLLGVASAAIALMLAAQLGSGFINKIPFVGGAASSGIEYISQWVGYAIMIFVIVGIIHAFVLPMLPMIMVFIMGVSWLILFLEAAIAGILWAFAFIRMDGHEFFDKNQAPGVTLLFNLLLRPALGMLAYCGMLLLLPKLMNSLTLIWDEAFAAQTGNVSLLFLWQFIAGLVLFTYMQWHLTLRLTGLIPSLPDRVGHWMGMQMHGYNDGQETSAAVGALVGAGMAAGRAPLVPGAGGNRRQQVPNKISSNSEKEGDKEGKDEAEPEKSDEKSGDKAK